MNNPETTITDPRCPYCGRPVIGVFVAGAEGKYHPACAQPPEEAPPQTIPRSPGPKIPIHPPWTQGISIKDL